MVLLLLALISGPKTQDDAWGECPAFQHRHPTKQEALANPYFAGKVASDSDYIGTIYLDGMCHFDDSDLPVVERPKLLKPKFNPDPKRDWL